MKTLYSKKEFENTKSRDLLPLICSHCSKTFFRTKHFIQIAIYNKKVNKRKFAADFCSSQCYTRELCPISKVDVICEQCGSTFKKSSSQIKSTKHNFCSCKCAGKYRSMHKTTGTRVSKLEKVIQRKIISLYPEIKFEFNHSNTIKSELDIYIPSLKLAFELNGIFHYKPIFGEKKFLSIINADNNKIITCKENGITLHIIDTSTNKKFKEEDADLYIKYIQDIIESKIKDGSGAGDDPVHNVMSVIG